MISSSSVPCPLSLSDGWSARHNRHGNPKLVRRDLSIDLIPFASAHQIQSRGIEPTIEIYLIGVPLTIQSIAYDVASRKLIGEIGLRALATRTVGVNDPRELAYCVARKGVDEKDYVLRTAASLGFTPILSYRRQLPKSL